jgi:hypothetical protein
MDGELMFSPAGSISANVLLKTMFLAACNLASAAWHTGRALTWDIAGSLQE